jgi:hypothetical protein
MPTTAGYDLLRGLSSGGGGGEGNRMPSKTSSANIRNMSITGTSRASTTTMPPDEAVITGTTRRQKIQAQHGLNG